MNLLMVRDHIKLSYMLETPKVFSTQMGDNLKNGTMGNQQGRLEREPSTTTRQALCNRRSEDIV